MTTQQSICDCGKSVLVIVQTVWNKLTKFTSRIIRKNYILNPHTRYHRVVEIKNGGQGVFALREKETERCVVLQKVKQI